MSSTDPKWVKLQKRVCDVFNKCDSKATITIGSGNVKGNGDVISSNFMIECKQRTRKNITIEQNHWNKIVIEAELLDKIPAIVCENESSEIIISLRLNDFRDLHEYSK